MDRCILLFWYQQRATPEVSESHRTTTDLRKYISILALPLLLTVACQQESDPTGIGLLPDEDLVNALRYDTSNDSARISGRSYTLPITAATSPSLSVGEADGFSARALLRWQSLPNTIADSGRIVSARLRLYTQSYAIGDESRTMNLELREITSYWSSFTFTSDSLVNLQTKPALVGSASVTLGDADSVDIAVDSTLIRTWFRMMKDERYFEIRGVQLTATASGVVRAFNSAEGSKPPKLEIVMDFNGALDTLEGLLLEDTYVATGPSSVPAQRIILQGGAAARSHLFFDVDAIPPASVVNNVKLYLHIDRTLSTKFYRGQDSLIVYETVDSTTNTINTTPVVSRIDGDNPDVLIAEGVTLTRLVQQWVNRRGNKGLTLVKISEISDLDRLVFYNADAEAARRPRLLITYTSQP